MLVALLVLVVTGGSVLVGALGRDEGNGTECDPPVASIEADGIGVLLDDQGDVGTDPCDLSRRGPTPSVPYVRYDCRVVVPVDYDGPELPDRTDPTNTAGTCRQPG